MSRDGPARKPDSREKGRSSPDDSGQWVMMAFNQITGRLDRIEKAVENLKKVVWTAAGVILAFGIIASVLFGFRGLITEMAPVEITIQRLPVP